MNKVSVIVPVYKAERYIALTIQSLVDQTYKNLEILIVDDGSPDRSFEICQQFTDPRIQIICQENRGLAGARNTGIRHATGDYIGFLDADDLWLPEKLAKHIEHLENTPDVGVSFSFSQFMDENGQLLNNYVTANLGKVSLSELFRTNPVGNGSAAVLRKEVLQDIRFEVDRQGLKEDCYFDEMFRRSEDYELWLRIAIQTNWEIEGIPHALTQYRVNSKGLSANLQEQYKSWEQVLEKLDREAPDLMSQWKSIALAYHFRYLARSAVRLKLGSEAVAWINRSLLQYWKIALEEPRRTVKTLISAYSLALLPQSLNKHLEAFLSRKVDKFQRRRIAS